MVLDSKNYYEILEIQTDASQDEISREYTRAKNAYSTESLALYSLMTLEECEQILELIEEAYSVLSDPQKRRLYNKARGLSELPEFSKYETSSSYKKDSYGSSGNDHAFNINSDEPRTRSSDKKDITKIVATKKFALEYPVNQEFEQEIEQTTIFTGEFLRKIREYKQVDIDRMSDMTKVSKTYLKNIEDDNYEHLPVMVYVRGFVFQYAKCLKLNPELVASSYINHLKQLKESK